MSIVIRPTLFQYLPFYREIWYGAEDEIQRLVEAELCLMIQADLQVRKYFGVKPKGLDFKDEIVLLEFVIISRRLDGA